MLNFKVMNLAVYVMLVFIIIKPHKHECRNLLLVQSNETQLVGFKKPSKLAQLFFLIETQQIVSSKCHVGHNLNRLELPFIAFSWLYLAKSTDLHSWGAQSLWVAWTTLYYYLSLFYWSECTELLFATIKVLFIDLICHCSCDAYSTSFPARPLSNLASELHAALWHALFSKKYTLC